MDIECWENFNTKIDEIKSMFGSIDQILFRGQPECSSCMPLKTTLERYTKKDMYLEDYLDITFECVNPIEFFTGKKFNLPKKNAIISEMNKKSNSVELHLPMLEYWIYLRHHGFPSPLLDWTLNPNIAAFFAFSGYSRAERCSVYVYIERPKGVKVHLDPGPKIWTFGSKAMAHKRYFLQQSCYTMTLRADQVNPDSSKYHNHRIISHEEKMKFTNKDQDMIIEISIPRKESYKVLNYLDEYNLNHFSLFQSEESLMQTLALKLIK